MPHINAEPVFECPVKKERGYMCAKNKRRQHLNKVFTFKNLPDFPALFLKVCLNL